MTLQQSGRQESLKYLPKDYPIYPRLFNENHWAGQP